MVRGGCDVTEFVVRRIMGLIIIAQDDWCDVERPELQCIAIATFFYFMCVFRPHSTRNSSRDEIANVNFLYDDIVHVLQNTIDSNE